MIRELYCSIFKKIRGYGFGFGLFNKFHSVVWGRLRPEWQDVNGYQFAFPQGKDTALDDGINIAHTGPYEPEVLDALKKHLKPGMVFLDMGANVGIHTVMASKLVGPEGRVIAVEPNIVNIGYLVKNIVKNGCANVIILPYAIGEKIALGQLHISKHISSGHSLLRRDRVDFKETQDTIVANMDYLMPYHVDFIKMDIEGYEIHALEGMVGILSDRENLKGIIFEANDLLKLQGYKNTDLFEVFKYYGFRVQELDGTNYLALR